MSIQTLSTLRRFQAKTLMENDCSNAKLPRTKLWDFENDPCYVCDNRADTYSHMFRPNRGKLLVLYNHGYSFRIHSGSHTFFHYLLVTFNWCRRKFERSILCSRKTIPAVMQSQLQRNASRHAIPAAMQSQLQRNASCHAMPAATQCCTRHETVSIWKSFPE